MATKKRRTKRTLDARPDTLDFRDAMYVSTLVEVPGERSLSAYLDDFPQGVEILDQGEEGACTGFGLAAVANYLLRTRSVKPEPKAAVSPRMLYELAKRYDEWRGESYEGSSARGAMKGWHKHGVCAVKLWPHLDNDRNLTPVRVDDARKRPLGAYYRVNHKDIVAMHCAISEVGVLYATSVVHKGWDEVGSNGIVPYSDEADGGHAFAIVGYDKHGFWIQNSWGKEWGKRGFCRVSYDDWLTYGTDVWVARLGVAIELDSTARRAIGYRKSTVARDEMIGAEVAPHLISLGNDGEFREHGTFGTTEDETRALFQEQIPKTIRDNKWQNPRIVFFAHGGLVSERSAVSKLAGWMPELLAREIYPIFVVWHTDIVSTLRYSLLDALKKRSAEGFLESAWEFIEDRKDDMLEAVLRQFPILSEPWKQMKQNARAAWNKNRGMHVATTELSALCGKSQKKIAVHAVAHSAGSILLSPLAAQLQAGGQALASTSLWAPACTLDLFHKDYLSAVRSGACKKLRLFTLYDKLEKEDNCAGIYHRSLLYLVSNAFEDNPFRQTGDSRKPVQKSGYPLLGMEKHLREDAEFLKAVKRGELEWILCDNKNPEMERTRSGARHHSDFDDDKETLRSTFATILGSFDKVKTLELKAKQS